MRGRECFLAIGVAYYTKIQIQKQSLLKINPETYFGLGVLIVLFWFG